MRQRIIEGPKQLKFPVVAAAYLPFYGNGFHNTYYRTDSFEIDILTYSGGTCGAPAVISGGIMAGFLTEGGGVITSDTQTITVTIPENQKVLYIEGGSEQEQWDAYNDLVEVTNVDKPEIQTHWLLPEYVTWVEQKATANTSSEQTTTVLNQDLVLDFAKRIKALGLPPGKLTIDDGWQTRTGKDYFQWTDGYWTPDKDAFPDMTGLVKQLEKEGFEPCLWMGIPSVPLDAPIIKEQAELFDEVLLECPNAPGRCYYKPSDLLVKHFIKIIEPHVASGFRKFKFDFFYGPRYRMRAIMKCIYRAVKSLDVTVEIEGHHSDPFFLCWCDTFRMNDVIPVPGYDWQGLTLAHMNLGIHAMDGYPINMDHAGGNNPGISEEDYIKHMRLFELMSDRPRYPVISLLPDHDQFGEKAVNALKHYIDRHCCCISK